jgi:hypothetical protein
MVLLTSDVQNIADVAITACAGQLSVQAVRSMVGYSSRLSSTWRRTLSHLALGPFHDVRTFDASTRNFSSTLTFFDAVAFDFFFASFFFASSLSSHSGSGRSFNDALGMGMASRRGRRVGARASSGGAATEPTTARAAASSAAPEARRRGARRRGGCFSPLRQRPRGRTTLGVASCRGCFTKR